MNFFESHPPPEQGPLGELYARGATVDAAVNLVEQAVMNMGHKEIDPLTSNEGGIKQPSVGAEINPTAPDIKGYGHSGPSDDAVANIHGAVDARAVSTREAQERFEQYAKEAA